MIPRLAGTLIATTSSSPSSLPIPTIAFPYLAVLLSGGHSMFLIVHDVGRYSVLGGTLDDSLGEALDKIVILLKLKDRVMEVALVDAVMAQRMERANGGALVELFAQWYQVLPCVVITTSLTEQSIDHSYFALHTIENASECVVWSSLQSIDSAEGTEDQSQYEFLRQNDFVLFCSLSHCRALVVGLKTAFRRLIHRLQCEANPLSPEEAVLPLEVVGAVAALFQEIAFEHVRNKLEVVLTQLNADDNRRDALMGVVIVGGVAANTELRR